MRELYRMTLLGAAAVALLVLGPVGAAFAFHGGGVAHCDGCHTMHNSADNRMVDGATENSQLLKGSDPSSTCLNCHSGSGSRRVLSTDGSNVNSGGDFHWVATRYSYLSRSGAQRWVEGESLGHNVIAVDFGLVQETDPDNQVAPGGTYLASNLGCTSCHDPHGQVGGGEIGPITGSGSYGAEDPGDGNIHGNYRLLGDSGYTQNGLSNFANDAPVARAYNGSSAYGEKVDYGSGMSEWCANCHNDFIGEYKHPAGNGATLGGTISTNYGLYVKTGDFGGDPLTSFDGLVPFERGETDGSRLSPDSTAGPSASANVMCLTCHRAHASAFPNAGRWDLEEEFLKDSVAYNAPETIGAAVYYKDGAVVDVESMYGDYQRSLCNKCHHWD